MTASPALERPIFVIAAPRSGSSMLFEALARAPALWTLGGEAHVEFESVPGWHPRDRAYASNRLTVQDLRPGHRQKLLDAFAPRLRDAEGVCWHWLMPDARPDRIRFLEKTPKNSLRVSLLRALFPDARFIFLFRDPRGNIGSMLEAWRSGRFVTYRNLPAWPGPPWSLLLPPGWQELAGAPLERIAAFQWRAANETALDDLQGLPADAWCSVRYEDLVAESGDVLKRLWAFVDLPGDPGIQAQVAAKLPNSRHTLTPPDSRKWRIHQDVIESVLPELDGIWRRLQALRPLRARLYGVPA